jgi:hypothetical protein
MLASLLSFHAAQFRAVGRFSARSLSALVVVAGAAGSFPALASSVPDSPTSAAVESVLPQLAAASSVSIAPASVSVGSGGTVKITATVTESTYTAVDSNVDGSQSSGLLKLETSAAPAKRKGNLSASATRRLSAARPERASRAAAQSSH